MRKGPNITPDVEALIAAVYEKHPKWRAPTVRHEVESILRKKDKASPKGWPSLSKVQKVLAIVRRTAQENLDNPLSEDKPWSISTWDECPIPPEALPSILRLWVYQRERYGHTLSKRCAKWAARLYPLEDKLGLVMFAFFVDQLVIAERMYELSGRRLVTAEAYEAFMAWSTAPEQITLVRARELLTERNQAIFDNLARIAAGIESDSGYSVALYEPVVPKKRRGGKK